MTPERKDEIWAMLDADTQEWIKEQYEEILEDIADYKAQNTESGSPIMENRAIGQKQMLIRLFGSHNLTAQAEEEPKEPNHIPDSTKMVDYAQYRLDLAKEIAVAMIPNYNDWDIPIASVNLANKIIKNLKKTENDF